MIVHILEHAIEDLVKMLPFLFVAFLLIEALEHYSTEHTKRMLARVGKAGPLMGAAAGCVPQCGFSVIAANLYAGGIISVGTLVAVFIATSDEAVLIMLGNPGHGRDVLALLAAKVVIGVIAGYVMDLSLGKYISVPKENGNLCERCGCHDHGHEKRILRPALNHTFRVFLYLYITTVLLNLCIELVGEEQLAQYLLGDTAFQPLIAAAIGLIPNCVSSVILTQLYLGGAISFASVIAGLSAGAGVGLLVLFRVNRDKKESLKILAALYITAVLSGVVLQILPL